VDTWLWTVRRQTTPGPGGLIDKGRKGKQARTVPLIEEIRPMIPRRLLAARAPEDRLFTGPKGGRIAQRFCGTRRTGMRWSANSDMIT
jgi:integrase